MKRLAVLLCSATLAAALTSGGGRAQEPADHRDPPSINVVGEGTATAVPDIAIVTSGVVTRADTAGAALKANSAAMTKVLAVVKAAKVEDRDVGTSGLTVQPQYDYADNRAPKLSGYEVRNAVTIRARDLDGLGGLLDNLVGAGSNQIEGLVFDVADREAKLDEARKAAIADARRKAELFAAEAGVKLGSVIAIDERTTSPEPVRPYALRAKAMDSAAAVPIARGEQELRAEVSVRWSIAR